MWTKNNIPDLTGKTAIVTGANTGIGFETAKALYEAGAHVIVAARDEQKAHTALKKIESEASGKGTLEVGLLDLASLEKIKKFADWYSEKHEKLDILINNAGVMIPPPSKTDDGFELQFGVNFIGHFALTGYLFPFLSKSADARIVTLSSGAAIRAEGIDFNNLKLEKGYDDWREYAVSKLADILFTYELDRKLKKAGSSIVSVAAHPGVTRTDLQRNIPEEQLQGLFEQFKEIMEPWQGALPALFVATDPSVKGGEFFGPDGENEYAGYPALSKHNTPSMNDMALADKLWKYAENATGIRFEL
ncbi:NAD(P)-dependent dehydrogenase, short-chain alcohol dehydrogenase family [Chryseobacterium arachidis]|uniref:NAD(P)-dependent dehydrogenase, short-chain alcohol dehydrogenase family n=2 Tax=Chryseobacterium arachidis TaxID=1416778 RepID=A0A1M5G6A1_9FLAO|nr:oxidoreductase [Chryseobacterium arachidis]SHF99317.1 NAD(P)-dependent dehydrogenase, short-chain alcohol dehydrogenase family [Chryseobacterium arachidis]